MNKDQVTGRLEQVKGKAKELTGDAVGNSKLKAVGQMDQIIGKIRSTLGDTKEAIKAKTSHLTHRT